MPLKNDWDTGDQFTADDANNVADAVNSAYVKPGDGIPKADLVSAVQVSLGKADTAVQAVDAATISDSTSTGRAVLKATDAAAARTAIGVAYGTTSGTVAQGNDSRFSPSAAAISDSTSTGRAVLTAADAAAARSVLGVSYGSTSGTVVQGNDSRVTNAFQGRVVSTVSSATTLAAAAKTDYVTLVDTTVHGTTVSLVHFDGSNGSTVIADNGYGSASSWACAGGSLSTAQKKFGTASWYGGLFYPDSNSSNWTFGSGDFSVECFVYPTTTIPSPACLFDFRENGENSSAAPYLYLNGSKLYYKVNGSDRIVGTATVATNTWTHIALCRVNGDTKLYVNGTQDGLWYDGTEYTVGALRPIFLRNAADAAGGWNTTYIDEIRVVKGGSAYSANFTPPSSAFSTPGAPSTTISTVVTLPTAVGNGNEYTIKNINLTWPATIATTSSQKIDGVSTVTVTPGSTVRLISDGANWRTI